MDGLGAAPLLLLMTLALAYMAAIGEAHEDRSIDICTLPPETGVCRMSLPRYFYNATSEQCEEFVYGGCRGNLNRFRNKTTCEDFCSRPVPEVYEDRKIDVCTLPAEPGLCMAIMPRYFYNSTSEQCEEFNYGGCGGNPNRFDNMAACEAACSRPAPEAHEDRKIDICTLPPETGVCRMSLPMYFYNATSEQCEEFVYGGCHGNLNRFRNKTTCEGFCSRPVPEVYEDRKIDVCTLPAEPGRCMAIMPRYFYNSTSEQCEEFNYGGCGGNPNRFDNMAACETACSPEIEEPEPLPE